MTNPVHVAFHSAGFTPEWTGGNCQAWRKRVGNRVAYICDESSGLGDSFDEEYRISIEDPQQEHGESLFAMTGDFAEVTEYAELHLGVGK